MNEAGNTINNCAEAVPSFRPVTVPVNRRRGFVYFVTDGEMIKIGHSIAPTERVKALQSPGKKRLRLLAFFPGFMDEEHNLHRLFAEHLAHLAEWFRPHSQITEFIATLESHRGPLDARVIMHYRGGFGR